MCNVYKLRILKILLLIFDFSWKIRWLSRFFQLKSGQNGLKIHVTTQGRMFNKKKNLTLKGVMGGSALSLRILKFSAKAQNSKVFTNFILLFLNESHAIEFFVIFESLIL